MSARSAAGSSRRDEMPSLPYAWPSWVSIVSTVTKSACATSRFESPCAASSAARSSAGVSASRPETRIRRGRAPLAASSPRARRASAVAPQPTARSSASFSGSRPSRRWRADAVPRRGRRPRAHDRGAPRYRRAPPRPGAEVRPRRRPGSKSRLAAAPLISATASRESGSVAGRFRDGAGRPGLSQSLGASAPATRGPTATPMATGSTPPAPTACTSPARSPQRTSGRSSSMTCGRARCSPTAKHSLISRATPKA